MRYICYSLSIVCAILATGLAYAQSSDTIDHIAIMLETDASNAVQRVAEALKARIQENSQVDIQIASSPPKDAQLRINLGEWREQGRLHLSCEMHDIELPARIDNIFPEGFAAKTASDKNGPMIVAVGADARGVLYAAGEIVRQLRYHETHVMLADFDVSSAPAYRFRGFSTNQGGTMRKITGARTWTEDEVHAMIMEYAMAGANMFYSPNDGGAYYDYVKSFDLMTETGARPNQLRTDFPEAWRAGGREEWEGTNWVCPSIPEARAALLAQWEEDFKKRADHDVLRLFAGDPGGCTDARCTPWGKTFVEFSEELAAIWLKYHPNSTVQIANQGLDNAGDQAIFDYLNEKPRAWSYGISYGPGSNAMSPYFRDIDMRDDLFAYAGDGPVNRYLSEIHRALPSNQRIVHYSDITHWISAQYQVRNPEPNIMKAFGRRTFHARPEAMYLVFKAVMPFSEGDIIYSEGNHDEFHQYMWARLLWDPNRTLDDVMQEYCVLWFGEEAAPKMKEALLQLENNLEAPLATNEDIGRYYTLVREAGDQMPAWRMARDYHWRLHMQKAALDQYVQHKLRIEMDKQLRIRELLAAATSSRARKAAIADALTVLAEPKETDEMRQLREQARVLGEETDKRHGDRNPGYFKLDESLRELPEIETLLQEAQADQSKAQKNIAAILEKTTQRTRTGNIFW